MRLSAKNKQQLWNSRTKRKTKNRLRKSSRVQPTRKVVFSIVQDAHHVHVFTSRHAPTTRAATIAIRIRRRAASVLRALAQDCRARLLSVAVIVPVTIIIRRVAISLVPRAAIVPVPSMDSLRKVAISPVLRVAIVPVPSMDSLRKVAISPVLRAAIVPVHSMDSLRKAVTSLVAAISPVVDSSLGQKINTLASKSGANYYTKHLDGYSHLVVMLYAVLSNLRSLREVCLGFAERLLLDTRT